MKKIFLIILAIFLPFFCGCVYRGSLDNLELKVCGKKVENYKAPRKFISDFRNASLGTFTLVSYSRPVFQLENENLQIWLFHDAVITVLYGWDIESIDGNKYPIQLPFIRRWLTEGEKREYKRLCEKYVDPEQHDGVVYNGYCL